ncbi:MAG: class I SAM-dependent methyltransferase [Patescibacteria group bacterium]
MINLYQKIIAPYLLNFTMGLKNFEKIRRIVITNISGNVLEIGVGPGYNMPLYKNISKLYALEPSKELIDIAKTRVNTLLFPVEFLNTEAEKISLQDHVIDNVVSTWTLCSVSDPRQVLQEIKRVLRPQGNFIFFEHGAFPNHVVRVIQVGLTYITKYFTGNCHYDRKIEELIKEAGFSIKKIEYSRGRFNSLLYNYRGIATLL